MPPAFRTSIKKDGKFFQGDPAKKFQANVRLLMQSIAEAGEADVVGQLRAGQGNRAPVSRDVGRVASYVRGRTRSLTGKQWKATAVVSVNNSGLTRPQGIALMAAASRLEAQTGAFRKTRGRLARARRANIDLLKGLR